MKFGAVPLSEAKGKILGHNIAGLNGQRLLRKGRPLEEQDIQALASIGRENVYVAELEADDLNENEAAGRIANACSGAGVRLVGPAAGRVNLLATGQGVLRIDVELLERINGLEGLTLSTKYAHTLVQPKEMVATVKIIPYSLPLAQINCVEKLAGANPAGLIRVDELVPQPVGMIFSGSASMNEKLREDFAPLIERILGMGSYLSSCDTLALEDAQDEIQLAELLRQRCHAGAKIIILAGETAIMDRHDVIPRALERAGGEVEVIGAPVDPGNLLMLGYLEGTPVLGAPGCARSKKLNIIDWVLPRLLAGDHLIRTDFIRLGHGGLLEDTQQRPLPRDRVEGEMLVKDSGRRNDAG